MKFILYIPLFIIFQLVGDELKALLHLPVPGASIGLLLLLIFLFIIPQNKNITNAAQKLLLHLPLFFIPAGVGIMQYTEILKQDSLALFASVFGSTILCFILAACLTQGLLKTENIETK
ncbi:MAG: holin-like protein [Oleiphilaceae bacterium]|jgi:holin-like protein